MTKKAIVIGIDGGGTRTRCVVADLSGRLLGMGKAGPSNYHSVGLETAAANLEQAVREALAKADRSVADVTAVYAGLAGAGRPEDRAQLTPLFDFVQPARVEVTNDGVVALEGALDGAPGVILVAGTGSIALGKAADGSIHRVGGWGWVLGDEGSGFDIGRGALVAALAALDQRGPKTSLGERIVAEWQLERLDQVVGKVYADPGKVRMEIAALAPLVATAAAQGDAVAKALLVRAGVALGDLGAALLQRMALPAEIEPLVATTGGVATSNQTVRAALEERLIERIPGARLVAGRYSPAEGAVRLAIRLAQNRS